MLFYYNDYGDVVTIKEILKYEEDFITLIANDTFKFNIILKNKIFINQ